MEKFCLLVVGSRGISNYTFVASILDEILSKVRESYTIEIVSGGARGVDSLAERYASENDYSMKVFPANWDKHGKSAGYIRNDEMFQYISKTNRCGVVAFWDGESKGTQHSIHLAEKYHVNMILYNTRTCKYSYYRNGDSG